MIRSLASSHSRFGQYFDQYLEWLTNSSLSAALCLAGVYSMSWVPSTDAQTVTPALTEAAIDLSEAASEAVKDVTGETVTGEDAEAISTQQLRERLQRLQEGAREIPALPTLPSRSNLISRFPSLGSSILDVQLAGYMSYVESLGTPDILIVGSSRALQGIDPEALSDRLSEQGYDSLKVYNFSVNGATAQVVNFILGELLPGELPPVVVWGDGSRAFNEGRRDRTWEGILSSPGYQAIRDGERPSLIEAPPATEMVDAISDEAIANEEISNEIVDESGSAPLSNAEALLNRLRNNAAQSTETTLTSDRRFEPSVLETLGLNHLGFSAVGSQFDPLTYYQEFPQVNGQYDGAYSPFILQGDQTSALAAVAELVRSQSTQLIFVNLPLSDSYLDDFRLYYESQFQRFLQTQGAEHQFAVIDLLQAWPRQPELFADPSHINQTGASAIAAQLALDPSLISALEISTIETLMLETLSEPNNP